MSDNGKNRSDQELSERLASLEARLDEKRQKDSHKAASKSDKQGFGKAMKMSSEFIAAIIVGAMLGYLLDEFAGTALWHEQ